MRNHTLRALIPAVILSCMLIGPTSAGEKKVNRKEVPVAVLAAFERMYPNSTVKGYAMEVEEGQTLYEIESVQGKTSRDILYSVDGRVAEIEEGITTHEIPEVVMRVVSKEYPKGKIAKAERTSRGSVVEYEIHIVSGKTKHSLVIDPEGKIVKQKKAGGKQEDND